VVDFQYRWSPAYAAGMERVLRAGVPSTFTFHNVFGEGGGILRPFSYVNDTLMKLHIAKYDRIACVSEFVRRDLVSRGFPAERVRVCHNALDAPADSVGVAQLPGPFGLFVGRLVRTKGVEHLLYALEILRDLRGSELDFVVAGEGPRRDRLARLAARLGLQRVRFAGQVPEDEKWRMLRSCSLFVLPSIAESFGLALLEAMSIGRPVVASRVGGVPEVVGDAGIIVPAGSPPALARAIGALLDDPGRARHLGAAAAARASRFTWPEAAGTMLAMYSEAIDERRSPLSSRRPHRTAVSVPAARAGDGRAVVLEPFRSDS
jgi:glycosyltransferase involved in cell wall biosynthesis